jgi:hypothetical protein
MLSPSDAEHHARHSDTRDIHPVVLLGMDFGALPSGDQPFNRPGLRAAEATLRWAENLLRVELFLPCAEALHSLFFIGNLS